MQEPAEALALAVPSASMNRDTGTPHADRASRNAESSSDTCGAGGCAPSRRGFQSSCGALPAAAGCMVLTDSTVATRPRKVRMSAFKVSTVGDASVQRHQLNLVVPARCTR